MEMVIGMLGALVGVGLFVLGFVLGKQSTEPKAQSTTVENTDEELTAIRDERERLIQEQKAFKELMNYNANMAYGITSNPLQKG